MKVNPHSEIKSVMTKEPCPLPPNWERIQVMCAAYKNHNTREITFSHPYDPVQMDKNIFGAN